MRNYLLLSLLFLPGFSLVLFSQGLPFFSSYTFSDPKPSLFTVNASPNGRELNTISIPFSFPAELSLGLPPSSIRVQEFRDPLSQIQIFSPIVPFHTTLPLRNPEGSFDVTNRVASTAGITSQHNVTYISYRKGVSFDMGLNFGLSLSQGGLAYVDVAEPKLRVKYRLNRNIFSFVKNSRWELFLQLSELHRFDGDFVSRQLNTALKVQDPAKSNFVGRQIYVTPGISISSSNLVFEGMVRVPINAREANRTLDGLWAPEIQGNLGLKYLFPVSGSAN